ncbi:MAG: 30S ribosomal protein S9 [Candidatus Saccharimonadales bacterium]
MKYYYGIGRRKEAVVTARIYSSGDKGIWVGDKKAEEYFSHDELLGRINQPLKLLDKEDKYRITLLVKGGGISGQADAARLAIANALVAMDEELRSTLKRAGYIKRDSRVKERKKYGLKRARKAPQFTKR